MDRQSGGCESRHLSRRGCGSGLATMHLTTRSGLRLREPPRARREITHFPMVGLTVVGLAVGLTVMDLVDLAVNLPAVGLPFLNLSDVGSAVGLAAVV